MSPPSHENAAALLRKQQSTTARLRVGLPALLIHLEHTDLLAPEPTEAVEGAAPTDPPGDPGTDHDHDPDGAIDDDWLDPPPSPRTWF